MQIEPPKMYPGTIDPGDRRIYFILSKYEISVLLVIVIESGVQYQ